VRLLGLSASFSRSEADLWMCEFCPSHRFVGEGLGRENLVLTVKAVETESERWLALASSLRNLKRPYSALVYCATRTECEETSRWLRSAGFPACSYHAGLPGFQRALRSRGFREGALRIVCATSAFGMGVDYPWVDRVIHFSLPYSLEAYWQEAGRAGRNGEEAHALAIWRRSEITRARWMKPEEKARFFALWAGWASGACRKRVVAESLGIAQDDCGVCDICRRETGSLPAWLQDIGSDEPVWWLQTEAQPREWAKRRIFPD
jgi:ATP-dependent DNA helicase RecQ